MLWFYSLIVSTIQFLRTVFRLVRPAEHILKYFFPLNVIGVKSVLNSQTKCSVLNLPVPAAFVRFQP